MARGRGWFMASRVRANATAVLIPPRLFALINKEKPGKRDRISGGESPGVRFDPGRISAGDEIAIGFSVL